MLKKIPTSQVRLGMFVQAVDGAWLSHPFWKTRFLLREPHDLELLQHSGVPHVWIDVGKGDDVAPTVATAPTAPTVPAAPVAPVIATPPPVTIRLSLEDEMERAAQLVSRSRDAVIALFGEARLGRAINSEQCLPLVEEVTESVARNPSALISLARLKRKDDYTYMHSVAVCALMVALARQLGLDDAQVREAGLAGLLHDIGKMAMPLAILNKPGRLSDAEFDVMRRHPQRGHDLLREGGAVPEAALDVCLHHHEKFDGSGYPKRLSGEGISLLARMGAICDVYDAITSARPYKDAWDPAVSIQHMAQWAGHFDPALFQAFVKSVGIYPVGTLVRLESGRLAVVIDQVGASLLKPIVRVFYSTRSKLPIPAQLLDLSAADCHDRIVGREVPEDWGFTHIDDLWHRPEARH